MKALQALFLKVHPSYGKSVKATSEFKVSSVSKLLYEAHKPSDLFSPRLLDEI